MNIQSICVYCGSSFGNQTVYAEAARSLAGALAARNIGLVYGGGNVGLMGVIANEMLRLGGEVTGVIPQALMDKEVGHKGLTHIHVVKDMHERKAMMAALSDGFIALPGGIGTLEELFEMLTWSQLDFHQKPIGVLNVEGFYAGLICFLQNLVDTGFVKAEQAALMMHEDNADALLQRLQTWVPQKSTKLRDALAAQALFP
ncbi:putative cytokinin riboside 5'-monophosphate phosphoribohydrolase [Oxalicibacterium flavum]|uniref:Cytokinin riboside 5'-monophosphate phosphoribohydrolase n=1 Tax=Oxalicibacterium flavum TaxID=179467 RepID=A0A8J2XX31_9BURK|nr:putative cytokinin riboside 5'-monophosphate phosphoribohydrolase [Oxalicibacterium flavum]